MDTNVKPPEVMHPEASWEFLDTHELGRLAFHLLGEVHIAPINYAVEGGRIYFLTSEGSKLFGVTANPDVAFEVDEITGEHATSVVCHGQARVLEGEAAYIVEQLPVRPWIDPDKHIVVEIEVDEIQGRSFDLSRPWTQARVD